MELISEEIVGKDVGLKLPNFSAFFRPCILKTKKKSPQKIKDRLCVYRETVCYHFQYELWKGWNPPPPQVHMGPKWCRSWEGSSIIYPYIPSLRWRQTGVTDLSYAVSCIYKLLGPNPICKQCKFLCTLTFSERKLNIILPWEMRAACPIYCVQILYSKSSMTQHVGQPVWFTYISIQLDCREIKGSLTPSPMGDFTDA